MCEQTSCPLAAFARGLASGHLWGAQTLTRWGLPADGGLDSGGQASSAWRAGADPFAGASQERPELRFLPRAGGRACGGQPLAGLPAVQASTEVPATVLLSTRLAWRSHLEQLLPDGQSRQPADWPAPARTQGCGAALQPRTVGEQGRPGVSRGPVSAEL